MHVSKLRSLASISAALAALVLPTTSWSQESGPAPGAEVTGDTILLGQTAAQSGPNAPTGEAKFGLEAYLAMVNARGGVKGKKLKLVSYDDAYQPAQTTALVKKLVYQDQVFAMVGSIGSPTNAAVYKMLDSVNVPMMGMGTGSPIFYQPTMKYVFPSWPLYTTDGKTIGAFVKRRFANQPVAIIYQDDAFGKPIREGILSQIGKADMEIPYVPSQVDFSSAVIKMKSAGIKVVVLATIATSGAQVLNQMASLGYKPTRILTASACGYTGIFKTIDSLDGAYCSAFLPAPGSNDPKWQAFTKAMGQYAPGQPADIYAAWGWLAGEVAVAGLERIKGPITRENFVAALNTLKDLPTIGGKLTYTAQAHSGICCQFLWQAKKDHWEVVPDSDFDGLK
jgi:branched-chain amino acid transport system substrate-binding protein